MIKAIILLFIFDMYCVSCICQNPTLPLDTESNKIIYTDVILFDSFSKNDIYFSANEWFVNTFNSAESVIQMNDKEKGIIIGKGYSDVYSKTSLSIIQSKLYYTIKIEIKENKYKFSIYDIYYLAYPNQADLNPKPLTSEFLYSIYMKEDYNKTSFSGKSKLRLTYVSDLDKTIKTLIVNLKNNIKPQKKENDNW